VLFEIDWNMKKNSDIPESFGEGLNDIPRDVGWILLITGLASELGLPGVPPFWIAGVMIVWPKAGDILGQPIRRRFPGSYDRMLGLVRRYTMDLKSRYP